MLGILLLLLINGFEPQVEVGELIVHILIEVVFIESQKLATMRLLVSEMSSSLAWWCFSGAPSYTLNSNTTTSPTNGPSLGLRLFLLELLISVIIIDLIERVDTSGLSGV